MNIEVLGAGFENKGAHLMLIAIVKELKRAFPGTRIAIRSKEVKNWDPGKLELFQKPSLSEHFIGNMVIRHMFDTEARQSSHMILDPEIDVVLDASGFKYSDQFGKTGIWRRARRIVKWKKTGKKVILLPQAFGPFKVSKIRKAVQAIADNVDLMLPRDRDSYGYLTGLVGERKQIMMYPDFTNMVKGELPDYFSTGNHRTCLIPNTQMIVKTSDIKGQSYIPFFAKCARYLKEKDLNPFILNHDMKKDRSLVLEIQKTSGIPLDIIEEEDPIKLKGIIGSCYLVVGSRYHALINALSQGVPAIATGWSHKYDRLFEDYGCPEMLISNLDFDAEALGKLKMLTEKDNYNRVVATLKQSAQLEIQKTERMWRDVIEVISR